jgi:PAS domain S-box-containing protein
MPLEINDAHFAAIVALADDAIFSHDLDGTITSWNRAAENLLEFTSTEAIGRSIRLIVPPDHRDEQREVLRRIGAGERVGQLSTTYVTKSGRRIDTSLTVSPVVTPEGQVLGASIIARPISDSMRFERAARHLSALVDSSDDAIVSKDLNGIVLSWNPAAEAMFGFSVAEMIGQSIRRIIPDDRQQEEDEVLARIRRGDRVDHYETIRRRKDGTLVPISLTVSPIRQPDGTIVGASKIARDITDYKRAEEERARLLQIAREASRLKDEFLATLSHELRTPLNAIVGYVRMVQSGLMTGEKQTRAMDAVSRNVTSLAQIVEDVLDVSRIVSGKLRLELQAVELPDVIRHAVETVRPAAETKGLRLETLVDPFAAPVSGDPDRLQQVLWNLLSNGVKFTPRGGTVQIRLERVDSHVEVSVSDTGIGMAADFLPFAFDRFRQADSSIGRAHGGLGIGLAITRHLVELHGGRISVTSDGPGKGSTFRVELPIRSVQGGSRLAPPLSSTAAAPLERLTVPELSGVRILAVDDDRDALALVREILETTGATVATADSGQQALEAMERATPDVLLADLGMPTMTGFELIDRVRRSDSAEIRKIPAAALTAYARSEDRTRALRSGFQMHLAKPIDPSELMAAMAALARTRHI